ncbi:MAG: questin oxidase family protein [Candidatus Baltobacteraceae bacterium]
MQYGGELADHLPMATLALEQMGASPARVDEFGRRYVSEKGLLPLEDAPAEATDRSEMRNEIARLGRDRVLRRELAHLMPSAGTGAFHPLIRLAYAIEKDDDAEVAAAIVYWNMARMDVAYAPLRKQGRFNAAVAAGALRGAFDGVALPGGLIVRAMEAAAACDAFADAVAAGGAPHDEHDLCEIARFVVEWFAATRGFVALHAMTATYAFRVLTPYLDLEEALPAMWWSLCTAYAAARTPEFDAPELERVPAWEVILTAAIASDDEHVIKAVYTAWREERAYGGPLYRFAAAQTAKVTGGVSFS